MTSTGLGLHGNALIRAIPYRDDKKNMRVMLLMTETRANRSGKAYTRRLTIHLTLTEFEQWSRNGVAYARNIQREDMEIVDTFTFEVHAQMCAEDFRKDGYGTQVRAVPSETKTTEMYEVWRTKELLK